MLVLTSPIYVMAGRSPEAAIRQFEQLLGAPKTERNQAGPKIQDFYLVGPQVSVNVQHVLERLNVPYSFENDDSQALGWGIWAPLNVDIGEAPLVQTFKHMAHLAERPVMTSEHRLRPGELIVVTRDSESFVTLVPVNDEPIPDTIQWFRWTSKDVAEIAPKQSKTRRKMHHPLSEPESAHLIEGRVVCSPRPWLLDDNPEVVAPLTREAKSFQLTPMLDENTAVEFAREVAKGPWARRIGDIYTQDALDIVNWSREKDCPAIVKTVVDLVHDPKLPDRVAALTKVPVESLREMFAYRLRGGDRILVHADSTYRGQLLVRSNWLLQAPAPSERPWDFRFWQPGKPEVTTVCYPALPNRVVFFLFGENNPHDVPVVPVGSKDRVNVVISFGRCSTSEVR